MGAGIITAGLGAIGSIGSKKKLNRLLEKAPKYEIQREAYDNQAIAKGMAYGRNRAIQQQEQQVDQDTQNAISNVQDVTSSTSALLSTIAAINANAGSQKRDLATTEAMIQNEGKSALMGANNAMIDEKDKRWNYNTNMPYQMKVAALRDRQKANNEMFLKGVETWAAEDSSRQSAAISAVGSMAGGMFGG